MTSPTSKSKLAVVAVRWHDSSVCPHAADSDFVTVLPFRSVGINAECTKIFRGYFLSLFW